MKRFNIFAIAFTMLLGSAAANATLVEFTFEGNVGLGTEANFGDTTVNLNGASMVISGTTSSDVNQADPSFDDLGMYIANATFEFFDGATSIGSMTTDLFYAQSCDDSQYFGCIGLDMFTDGVDGFYVDFGFQHGSVNADPAGGAVVLGSDIDCDGSACQTFGVFQPVVFENSALGHWVSLNLAEDAFHTYSVVALSSDPAVSDPAPAPAPAGILLLGLGLIGLGLGRSRKHRI